MAVKKRETVSTRQMATLFLAFLTGSAIVNIPAPLTGAAQNAAWISLWISNGLGMLLLAFVLYLHRKYPDMTFIEYSQKATGKATAIVIAIPLFLTLFLMLANIVGDIANFFKSTMMRETPEYIFPTLTLLTAALTARAGIEVMARMFTLLLIVMFFFSVVVIILALPSYHPEYLKPLFPEGFTPVLHGAYIAWGFPYAELALFTMILPFVRQDREPLGKFMYTAMIINGISLTFVIVCTIMAIGPMSANVKYSLFIIARMVEVREIIERIESIIGFALIAGSYMKTTIALFAINLGLSQLFRLQNDKILLFPISFLALLLSLTMFENEMEFGENVGMVWPLMITLFFVVPLLLVALMAAFMKRKESAPEENK